MVTLFFGVALQLVAMFCVGSLVWRWIMVAAGVASMVYCYIKMSKIEQEPEAEEKKRQKILEKVNGQLSKLREINGYKNDAAFEELNSERDRVLIFRLHKQTHNVATISTVCAVHIAIFTGVLGTVSVPHENEDKQGVVTASTEQSTSDEHLRKLFILGLVWLVILFPISVIGLFQAFSYLEIKRITREIVDMRLSKRDDSPQIIHVSLVWPPQVAAATIVDTETTSNDN